MKLLTCIMGKKKPQILNTRRVKSGVCIKLINYHLINIYLKLKSIPILYLFDIYTNFSTFNVDEGILKGIHNLQVGCEQK